VMTGFGSESNEEMVTLVGNGSVAVTATAMDL
jgi:hypothetical protein